MRIRLNLIILAAVFCFSFPMVTLGSEDGQYQEPSRNILSIMNVPEAPTPIISPDRKHLALLFYPSLPTVEDLARPNIGLAGILIDMNRNVRVEYDMAEEMALIDLATGKEKKVTGLPREKRITRAAWSSSGRYIAASILTESGLELWLVEAKTAKARPLYTTGLTDIIGTPFSWIPGQDKLLCQVIPSDRGPMPGIKKHRFGPSISDTSGKQTPVRTYRNLLQSLYDEILFDYLAKSRIAVIDTSGGIKTLGSSQLYRRVSPSPDGQYILAEIIQPPYSYLLPHNRFPYRVEIMDTRGSLVKHVASLPLADEIPLGSLAVAKGPRLFAWQSGQDATLWWAEALDKGNPRAAADSRDRLSLLKAPFDKDPLPVFDTRHRFIGMYWGLSPHTVVLETDPASGMIRAWLINPESENTAPKLLYKRMKRNDKEYPDNPLLSSSGKGFGSLQTTEDRSQMFLFEQRPSPGNDRCFLKTLDIGTVQEKIIWKSEDGIYEQPLTLLSTDGNLWLTRRESFTQTPNFYIRNLETKSLTPLTRMPHPAPEVQGITKEKFTYEREDGIPLTADLYLPPGYTPDQGPLPTLLWIYPRAYASIDNTAPRVPMDTRFIPLGRTSRMYWPLMGYALFNNPFIPIIGDEEGRPNDTFIEQLEMGAKAAVKALVDRGIADEKKIAVGGHSYGAFATANLLAHTDIFAAGIARSGAYNRTLTPFGFQHEFRDLWREPELYFKISPFNHASSIKKPLLLIHGAVDQNTGTFPEQSIRFYHALKGLGATARLVLLPYEDHSYYGRESVLHMIWEMQQWMDTHVKNN